MKGEKVFKVGNILWFVSDVSPFCAGKLKFLGHQSCIKFILRERIAPFRSSLEKTFDKRQSAINSVFMLIFIKF